MPSFLQNAVHTLARWCFIIIRKFGILPSSLTKTNDISTVYFFPIDHQGCETGEVIPVSLKSDGTADVSSLPTKTRERFESFGVANLTRSHYYFPQDGTYFLLALLQIKNGYTRFRATPNSMCKKTL